jgi:hypothetical protein
MPTSSVPPNVNDDKYAVLYKGLLYLLFIVYFIVIFRSISKDEDALSDKSNVIYLVAIILPLILFAYFILSNVKDNRYIVLLILIVLVTLFMLLKSYLPSVNRIINDTVKNLTTVNDLPPLSSEASYMITISSKLLLAMIVLFFISIIFSIFFEESYTRKSKTSIFFYALFFIPCLITDYFKYLLNELKTTPKVVYALVFAEIIFILLYVYLPRVYSQYLFKDNTRLVSQPIFLDQKQVIANADVLYLTSDESKKHSEENDEDPEMGSLMRNYSVSMWITLNRPSLGEKEESMIFRIGDDLSTDEDPDDPRLGAPYIGCKGSKLKIVYSNNVETDNTTGKLDDPFQEISTELDIPFQRWNYIVFNYHDNYVDLFINGILTETISLANFMPNYTYTQVITTGSNTQKIHGAICEVRIHKEKLNESQIAQSYNLLKTTNPPVNNIY